MVERVTSEPVEKVERDRQADHLHGVETIATVEHREFGVIVADAPIGAGAMFVPQNDGGRQPIDLDVLPEHAQLHNAFTFVTAR